jgi:DNA sulfur modification protein DndB
MIGACHYFLDPLIEHLENLNADEGEEYRKLYGAGAGLRYYHKLQQAVRNTRSEFNPSGLDEWLKTQDKQSNNMAREIVSDIEGLFKTDIRERLEDEYGSDWERRGVPAKLRKELRIRAIDKNLNLPSNEEVDPWDMMYLIDYRDILTQNYDLWRRRFEKWYTKPGEEAKAGGWKGRSSWIGELNEIRNDVSHSRGIGEEAFALLVELRSWLLQGEIDNEL